MSKTVFITGATGVMGRATLERVLERDDCRVVLLVRDSKVNRRKLREYLGRQNVEVIWGDLLDPSAVAKGVAEADIVLHMGGLVSPMADRYPEKTMKVNVGGTANIVESIRESGRSDAIKLVYIGSVAQTSDRMPPHHWGRCGDPVMNAEFDHYGLSKIKAERLVAESGLKYWVSLRQSGILHPGLFKRGSHPITFHVPLRGVLEWTTVEDSGNLMAAVCDDSVPEEFWRKFYFIGSGEQYRLTNYEFEKLILKASGSPALEKIFEPNWFATRNFHGCWFADSDRLEKLVPFRRNVPVAEYFRSMVKKAPWWTRLAPLAPAPVVKMMMKKVARTPGLGTLYWVEHNDCEEKINAFFGSREERERIPGWEEIDVSRPSDTPVNLDPGYDEKKPDSRLDLEDCRNAAVFRGGKCLSEEMRTGDLTTPLSWVCGEGHRFEASPLLVLKGGHWCEECLEDADARKRLRKEVPFYAQI